MIIFAKDLFANNRMDLEGSKSEGAIKII